MRTRGNLRRALPAALALGCLLVGGCGTSAPALSREERERLPLDGRQQIFDAENDVTIARNRADVATDQLKAVEARLASLDERQNLNERRLAANPATSGRTGLLRKVFRAEHDYLEARRDVAEAEVGVAEQEIRIARTRAHLAVQRQLVRIGKAPIGSLAAIEKSIDEQEAKGKETRSSSLELRTKAQALLDGWKLAEADYARQTGDYDSGIWLE